MPRHALFLLAAASLVAAPKPAPTDRPPPEPYKPSEGGSLPLGMFKVPDGLEVTLWARSPMLANPTNIDFDAQGSRRWLVGAYETPFAGGRLRLNGAYIGGDADSEYYDDILFPGVSREYQYFSEDRAQRELGLRWNRRAGANQLDVVAFPQWNTTDNYSRFDSPTLSRLFLNTKDISETVGRLHVRRTASPSLNLEAGVEGALNTLDSATSLQINGVVIPLPAANVRVEEKRGEAFAVATLRVSPKLGLELGVRRFGQDHLDPEPDPEPSGPLWLPASNGLPRRRPAPGP